MKPGILLGNIITATAGFALVSKGNLDFRLFAGMLIGLTLVMASGCVFNNYLDRLADEKMARTKNRPLATGTIPLRRALVFGTLLGGVEQPSCPLHKPLDRFSCRNRVFVYVVILHHLEIPHRPCHPHRKHRRGSASHCRLHSRESRFGSSRSHPLYDRGSLANAPLFCDRDLQI